MNRRAFLTKFAAAAAIAVTLFGSPAVGKDKLNQRNHRDNKNSELILPAEVANTSNLSIILGCPTDTSVVVSILSAENIEGYIEYGVSSGSYTNKTGAAKISDGKPAEFVLNKLQPDTQYFYRLNCKKQKGDSFFVQPEYNFHTCRERDKSFCFVVQADSHLDEQSSVELYKRTLANELSEKPDFMIDLGDTFMTDKLREKNIADIQRRYLMQRGFFGLVAHSIPLYLVLGNHDGETGWELDGTENNLAVWSAKARKTYFPNPEPDSFYTGSGTIDKFVGRRQNYYAWTWGETLFVVLDPYRFTAKKPGGSIDGWGWTLGDEQYNWFKETLEKSSAKFKFVFCHQLIGGGDEGRGGAEFAKYYEMGGFNKDGTWGFAEKRPGWGKPIHRLMADNKVTIFFHGHDHFFAKQELDGVIYQLVPQPSHPNFKNAGQAENYGYTHGDILPNSGYLRVTVSESGLTVDYIRTFMPKDETDNRKNGQVAYRYTIRGQYR